MGSEKSTRYWGGGGGGGGSSPIQTTPSLFPLFEGQLKQNFEV